MIGRSHPVEEVGFLWCCKFVVLMQQVARAIYLRAARPPYENWSLLHELLTLHAVATYLTRGVQYCELLTGDANGK